MVGNLGDYQRIVQLIKALGGPAAAKKYAALAAAGLVAIGGLGYAGLQKSVPLVKNWLGSFKQRGELSDVSYVVRSAATDDQGLEFVKGDVFRVLERDGDAVLIEIVGRHDNPWVVSGVLLAQISDLPTPEDSTDEGA